MGISIFSVLGAINFVAALFLALYVLICNAKRTQNKAFAGMSISFSLWSLFLCLVFTSTDYQNALFFSPWMNIAAIGLPVCFNHFIMTYLKVERSKAWTYLSYAAGLTLGVVTAIFPHLMNPSLSPKLGFHLYPNAGVLFYVFTLFFAVLVIDGLYYLFKAYKEKNTIETKVLFWVLVISFIGGSTTFPLVFNIPMPPFGLFMPLFAIIVMAFGITKYEILDVHSITKRSMKDLIKSVKNHDKMVKELDMAYEIQKRILPSFIPSINNYLFDAYFLPARQVSGDYYDFFIFSEDEIGIVIADIIGKGVPAALLTIELKNLITRFVSPEKSPAELFTELNHQIHENRLIDKYVPVIYGILNTKKNTFTYSNAGHEPGAYVSKGEYKYLVRGGAPLGMDPDERYEEEIIKLFDGDDIVLLTDGVSDGENDLGTPFGSDRIESIFKTHKSTQTIVKILKNKWLEYVTKEKPQKDDATIVGFKYQKLVMHQKKTR